MNRYSQAGQDVWIASLFPEGHKGFFMDLGCGHPVYINNTLLLEEKGWTGASFDVTNYSYEWRCRKTPFVCADVLIHDFEENNIPKLIDYLSLDIDNRGSNYGMLKRLFDLGFEFKAITIEHNFYLGHEFDMAERIPQRRLLIGNGYVLAKPDIVYDGNIFEDWWINPKYITL